LNTGISQIKDSQYEDAAVTLQREELHNTISGRTLPAALALFGRIEEAKSETKLFLAANPT
jgi:hypothetical protein